MFSKAKKKHFEHVGSFGEYRSIFLFSKISKSVTNPICYDPSREFHI